MSVRRKNSSQFEAKAALRECRTVLARSLNFGSSRPGSEGFEACSPLCDTVEPRVQVQSPESARAGTGCSCAAHAPRAYNASVRIEWRADKEGVRTLKLQLETRQKSFELERHRGHLIDAWGTSTKATSAGDEPRTPGSALPLASRLKNPNTESLLGVD